MAARLTKPADRRKVSLVVLLLQGSAAAAGASLPETPPSLRDCVAGAQNATAMAACERQEQGRLKGHVAELAAAIRAQLDARQRLVFDRNHAAWLAFLDSEIAMLELSMGQRGDGLGPVLQASAITLIYETRERQLQQHLHNLNLSRPPRSKTSRPAANP
jgi:uncharacterized protein YecT (DUF1311 family)